MRKFLFVVLLTVSAWAQTAVFSKSQTFTSATAGDTVTVIGGRGLYYRLYWYPIGAPAACTVAVDSSTDGSSWSAGNVIAGQTCTSPGSVTLSTASVYNYVRVNVTALTANKSVTVTLAAYESQPSGVGAVLNCALFPGADLGAQVGNCQAALPSTGGVIYTPPGTYTQTTAIVIGTPAKPVTWKVGTGTSVTVNVTGGATTDAIALDSASGLVCDGGTSDNDCQFTLASTANVRSLLANAHRDSTQESMFIQGVKFTGHSSATVANAIVEVQGLFAGTVLRDVLVFNFSGIGLWIRNAAGGVGLGPVLLDHVWINGGLLSGARPLVITHVLTGGAMSNIMVGNSSTIEHAGAGLANAEVNGTGVASISNVTFDTVYTEMATNADIGFKISDALNVQIRNCNCYNDVVYTTGACISIPASGVTNDISISNLKSNQASRTVLDGINTITLADTSLSSYQIIGTRTLFAGNGSVRNVQVDGAGQLRVNGAGGAGEFSLRIFKANGDANETTVFRNDGLKVTGAGGASAADTCEGRTGVGQTTFYSDGGCSSAIGSFNSSGLLINNLAGTGSRLVQADANGVLSAPATATSPSYSTTTNCADSAGAAACGSAAAGAFVIDAGTTSTVVSTTAVTANSQIFLQADSSLGTRLGVTCNTESLLVLGPPKPTARTAATSFTATIVVAPTTNPLCVNYFLVN